MTLMKSEAPTAAMRIPPKRRDAVAAMYAHGYPMSNDSIVTTSAISIVRTAIFIKASDAKNWL